MEIYCPKCTWHPEASARWQCACGHAWNTFETQGRCPACKRVWRDTQCLACTRWSKHHDWYHDLPPIDVEALLDEAPAVADVWKNARLGQPVLALRGPRSVESLVKGL